MQTLNACALEDTTTWDNSVTLNYACNGVLKLLKESRKSHNKINS